MNQKAIKHKTPDFLENFRIMQCLSSTENSYTYSVQKKDNLEYFTLKIFTRHSFSKKNYHILSRFTDKYFLIPKSYHHTSKADFLLFENYTTLKEILYGTGLSFGKLLDLGIDLTNIGLELLKYHFFEADISPNNIYQKEDGTFCLGDLNLQKDFPLGTPPYIPPEYKETSSIRKRKSKSNFEKAFLFSICMLLKNIYELTPDWQYNSFKQILNVGSMENPEDRYSSLKELQNLFLQEKKQESVLNSPVFQIKSNHHPLFERKTLFLPKKNSYFLFGTIWGCIIIAGCIFLVTLYQHLHPTQHNILDNTPSFVEKIETVSPIPSIKETEFYIATTPPVHNLATPFVLPSPKNLKNELDVQKTGLTFPPTDITDSINCIYAGENQIEKITMDFDFPYIQELYLNNNKLTDISGLSQIEQLEILCLSYNNIKDITSLTKLKNLYFLDISSNPEFNDMNSLLKMKQLTTLNISNTKISQKKYRLLLKKLPNCHIIY